MQLVLSFTATTQLLQKDGAAQSGTDTVPTLELQNPSSVPQFNTLAHTTRKELWIIPHCPTKAHLLCPFLSLHLNRGWLARHSRDQRELTSDLF